MLGNDMCRGEDKQMYPEMQDVQKGRVQDSALFKTEGGVLNIALGKGGALSIFNQNITKFEVLPR
jgi:hypothetical protein